MTLRASLRPMNPPLDQVEGLALCDLFLEVGMDASTLHEGWSAEGATHLLVGERSLRREAVPLAAAKRLGLIEIDRGQRQCPVVSRVPRLRTIVNGLALFILRGNLRRDNGMSPRPCDSVVERSACSRASLPRRPSRDCGVSSENRR